MDETHTKKHTVHGINTTHLCHLPTALLHTTHLNHLPTSLLHTTHLHPTPTSLPHTTHLCHLPTALLYAIQLNPSPSPIAHLHTTHTPVPPPHSSLPPLPPAHATRRPTALARPQPSGRSPDARQKQWPIQCQPHAGGHQTRHEPPLHQLMRLRTQNRFYAG